MNTKEWVLTMILHGRLLISTPSLSKFVIFSGTLKILPA
jgi:hypothetical protein